MVYLPFSHDFPMIFHDTNHPWAPLMAQPRQGGVAEVRPRCQKGIAQHQWIALRGHLQDDSHDLHGKIYGFL